MSEVPESPKSFFKEWLEQLQMESWQLELLISGLALFGIYEGRSLITEFQYFIDYEIGGGVAGPLFSFMSAVLVVGWRIFFINLLIHVILRGLWIGTIGLRYVSGEIDYDALHYSDRFTNFLKKKVGPYDDFIEWLEYICSVLFAYTFLLFLFFLSGMLYFIWIPIVTMGVEQLTGNGSTTQFFFGIFIISYLIFGLIVFLDFITLGGFKKIKEPMVSKVYMVIYRFFSTITLAFLYRPLFYNFIDNKSTRRLFYFSFPYIILLMGGNKLFNSHSRPYFAEKERMTHGELIDPCRYFDMKKESLKMVTDENKVHTRYCKSPVQLSQFYMDEPYPSIFMQMRISDKRIFESKDIEPIYREGFSLLNIFRNADKKADEVKNYEEKQDSIIKDYRRQLSKLRKELKNLESEDEKSILELTIDSISTQRDAVLKDKSSFNRKYEEERSYGILNALKDLHYVTIDGVDYGDSLSCHYFTSPMDGAKGILCHFSSEHIAKGAHELKIERSHAYNSKDERGTSVYRIPFIKTK